MINSNTKIGSHVEKIKFWNPITEIPKEEFDYIDLSSINKDSKQVDEQLVFRIFGKDAPSRSRQLINIHDVLVSTVRPNLNGVAIINRNFKNGTASTGYCVLRAKPSLDPKYLFYWVQSKTFIKDMINKASGASYPAVSDKIIKESEIPLPPLPTQQKIAAILDAADVYRQKTKTLIDKYDQLAQSLFLEMFGDPGKDKKGYEKCSFDNVAIQITDGDHLTPNRESSGYKLLSCRNIKYGFIDFVAGLDYVGEAEFQRMTKRCKPERNDILISCSGTIGRTTVVKTDEPFVLVRSAALVKLKKELVNPFFIEYYLRTSYMQSVMIKNANTSGQSNLFTGPIKKLPIMLPPLALQNQFAERVQLIELQKQQAQASLQKAEDLFNSLLQSAFKGELTNG